MVMTQSTTAQSSTSQSTTLRSFNSSSQSTRQVTSPHTSRASAPPTSPYSVRQDGVPTDMHVTVKTLTSTSPTTPPPGEEMAGKQTTSVYPVTDDNQSGSTIGVAVGVPIIGFIILVVIIVLVYLIVKRRRAKRREKGIVKIENPQYKLPPEIEERSMTLEKATLSVAPTVKFTANSNAAHLDANNTANSRKRKDAPLPPVNNDTYSKRTAPSPPKNIAIELYEKDSPAVSTENLTIVHNTNALVSPTSDDDVNFLPSSNTSYLQPLIDESPENRKRKSPRLSTASTSGSPTRPLSSGLAAAESDFRRPVSSDDDDSIGGEELATENHRTALLGGNKAASNMSLDSYDKSLNPFFSS